MSVEIWDIDGTLTTTGDTPRQDAIDYVRKDAAEGTTIVIVSARPISRLDETRAWLEANDVPHAALYLNDLADGTAPAVEFKKYKFEKLIEQYGADEIGYIVDNDADIRDMARSLGLTAYTVDEVISAEAETDDESPDEVAPRAAISVPQYMRTAAAEGLRWHDEGRSGDGLQPETVSAARDMVDGVITEAKVVRTAAWIRRHRGDWSSDKPQNADRDHPDWPQAGAVAAMLWGVNPADARSADQVLRWCDGIIGTMSARSDEMQNYERRAVTIGEFRVETTDTGDKTFSGYAALWAQPSAGLPFHEQIAPRAFQRTLSRVAAGQSVVKFLHGHDESKMLASTASGRLRLTEDETGLHVEARLDPADPDAAAVISKLNNEAAAMGMSFGFLVPRGGESWSGDQRTITEARLLEVSILSGHNPAYPATIGLSAVRHLTQSRLGIDAERLITTLDLIRSGQDLTDEDVEVLETVKEKLAPRAGTDPSVLALRHRLARLQVQAD